MLQSLHVKNLALMEETEVTFGQGLNILTGETGAGKSLLIGSVNLALGARFEKEMLRQGTDQALVELLFSGNPKARIKLEEMEIPPQEDDSILISRRMQLTKSVYRINGEVVSVKQVKELAEVLIDIHGQHEHQSLLHKKKHLEILDAFGGEQAQILTARVSDLYRECRGLQKRIHEEAMDERERTREKALAEYEVQEIREANLKSGEDALLEEQYRIMANAQKIQEALGESYSYTDSDGAGELIERAMRAMSPVVLYDKRLEELMDQLSQVDSLLSDYNRELSRYMEDSQYDQGSFEEIERRLNQINRLKGKYGNSLEEILAYEKEREEYLERLSEYDSYMQGLYRELEDKKKELDKACGELGMIRRANAKILEKQLREALVNLNFLTVEFEVRVQELEEPMEKGNQEVEFLISTNPGEQVRPLGLVASGGELSRIMLAIKTVLAQRDDMDALIFDEIDTGISGRTAWQVSRQLGKVANAHQVICITHLPQIAAMADRHFVIEKNTDGTSTVTNVRALDQEEALAELARLLGSDNLTQAALSNAREMRNQAMESKQGN